MLDYIKMIKKNFEIVIGGNSMFPTLIEGEKVQVRYQECYIDLKTGSIILFYNKKYMDYVVHRIIKIVEMNNGQKYYVTKGDNNTQVDEYLVKEEDIRGIVY